MQQRAQNITGLSYATFFQFSLKRKKNGHDNRKEGYLRWETIRKPCGVQRHQLWKKIVASTKEKII